MMNEGVLCLFEVLKAFFYPKHSVIAILIVSHIVASVTMHW